MAIETHLTREQVIKEWIADLRANPDKQGFDHLTTIDNGEEFDCCLGRLCRLLNADRLVSEIFNEVYWGEEEEHGTLPQEIQDYLDLSNDPYVWFPFPVYHSHNQGGFPSSGAALSYLNDMRDPVYGHVWKFEQIAAVIERQSKNWIGV